MQEECCTHRRIASPSEMDGWKALTAKLLDGVPHTASQESSGVQKVLKDIDHVMSDFAGLDSSEQRLKSLRGSVEAATKLAIDITKQQGTYTLESERPGTGFDAETMEDALQDVGGETIQGRPIKAVVFPAIKKWSNLDQAAIIRKAQVIL